MTQSALPYRLGCPAWSCRHWIGSVFPASLDPRQLLREYAGIFNAVEGNTFFYALPPLATLERWMAESNAGFRFSPKFPKSISHEHRLGAGAEEDTRVFLKALEALAHGNRLGVSFLQLPPSFNINHLDTLARYLRALPSDFSYAVEPRHISWFDHGDNEKSLDDLLIALGMDKVVFDSRPLFAAAADDESEREAMERKPQTPVRPIALGQRPVLRFIGRNQLDKNATWIREWAPVINRWILEKREPHVFAHSADDACAPFIARLLHNQLRKLNPLLPPLPAFPGEANAPESSSEQLDLFG